MNEIIEVPGFKHLIWDQVVDGQTVWLQGRALKEPFPYGPFKVVSKAKRTLENLKGNNFMHYAQDLIVPHWEEL